jgi:squalene-hopene/tetraprenyl-beta-curcumene cyclase
MSISRSPGLIGPLLLLATAAGLVGCGSGPTAPREPASQSRTERVDRALTRAAEFLAAQQAKDGAWRSDFYGQLKDGPSLTPLVMRALQTATPFTGSAPHAAAARAKGLAYLAALTRADGTIDEGPRGFGQPLYTAALATAALSQAEAADHRPARDAWLSYLRQRQLTESLGWRPSDQAYGGWGYCAVLPQKPAPGEGGPPLLESNLSATAFALAALRAAGCPADDPAFRAALVFVKRCQNHADEPARREDPFDDGGFFFIYDDAGRNKAGVAGRDRTGRERFASYGSATADGLGCLVACGLARDDARTVATLRWLETHFDVTTHPGNYPEDREASREAVYYYYCRSLASALVGLGVMELDTPAGRVHWADLLAEELLKRQREDSSWANDIFAQRENDPLVATSEAVEALATCRSQLAP